MKMISPPKIRSVLAVIWVSSIAIGLTWLFWWPLWSGGGLIGGDLYPYYFPQKALLADSLRNGIVPLWNQLVGFGYPTLGESQTGVLYPPNLILYSLLDLNTAYNFSQLLHYFIAFVATYAIVRRLELSITSAIFAATAFVYGWFPARICLEWTIIGGAWFAAFLWAETAFLMNGKKWSLVCMALFLGFDLLAGHYNLAFITLLMGVIWPFVIPSEHSTTEMAVRKFPPILIAIGLGFLIAAVQLLPSWELKTVSQRQEANKVFSPTYGHLPPEAISQLWMPWSWHGAEILTDDLLAEAKLFAVPDATNQVEAFLYCGLLTVVCAVLGLFLRQPIIQDPKFSNVRWRLLLVAILGLVFASGWPTRLLVDVPGFGFFRGPARYSIATAFAISILGACGLDAILERAFSKTRTEAVIGFALTLVLAGDLWLVSRQYDIGSNERFGQNVFYVTFLEDPPIKYRAESELRNKLSELGSNVRLYAPGPNVPTLLGVSALPVYLGLGPEIYETDQVRVDFSVIDPASVAETRARLIRFGVTHLLLEEPIDESLWDAELLDQTFDALLSRAFASEEYFLYDLNSAIGRAYLSNDSDIQVDFESTPHSVTATVPPGVSGELIIADLDYPGWTCTTHEAVDSEIFRVAKVEKSEEPQTVEWVYRPGSVLAGAIISATALIAVFLLPNQFFMKR